MSPNRAVTKPAGVARGPQMPILKARNLWGVSTLQRSAYLLSPAATQLDMLVVTHMGKCHSLKMLSGFHMLVQSMRYLYFLARCICTFPNCLIVVRSWIRVPDLPVYLCFTDPSSWTVQRPDRWAHRETVNGTGDFALNWAQRFHARMRWMKHK